VTRYNVERSPELDAHVINSLIDNVLLSLLCLCRSRLHSILTHYPGLTWLHMSPPVNKKQKFRHFRPVHGPRMAPTKQTPLPCEGLSLQSLADELLLCIIDQIDSQEALCNLAATCSRFQGLVEPYCWRSIIVTKGSHASRIAFSLNNRVERIAFVEQLTVRYNETDEEGIENLQEFMRHMNKLRHLHIESPCPNNSDYRNGTAFESWTRIDYTALLESHSSLPMLQTCMQPFRCYRSSSHYTKLPSHTPWPRCGE